MPNSLRLVGLEARECPPEVKGKAWAASPPLFGTDDETDDKVFVPMLKFGVRYRGYLSTGSVFADVGWRVLKLFGQLTFNFGRALSTTIVTHIGILPIGALRMEDPNESLVS